MTELVKPAAQLSLDHDTDKLRHRYKTFSKDNQLEGLKFLLGVLEFYRGKSLAGLRILDVGTGTGGGASLLADLVGPNGYVLGVDRNKGRIELARQTFKKENLSFEVRDALDVGKLDENSFDIITVQSVLHWVDEEDQPRAIDGFSYVLVPGGHLAVGGGSGDHFHPHDIKALVLAKEPYRNHPGIPKDKLKFFKLRKLENLLANSPFSNRKYAVNPTTLKSEDADGMIDDLDASESGEFISNVSNDIQPSLRGALKQELIERQIPTDEGFHVEVTGLVVVAANSTNK